jgi:hypothetical protein
LTWNNLTAQAAQYDFCQQWIGVQVPKCSACLTAGDSGHFLNNYLTLLDAACTQKPVAGSTLSIEGDPFSTVPINITTPTVAPLFTVPVDNSPISLGAKVGIAIGGVVFLLAALGCGIVCNGRRRRRKFLRRLQEKNYDKGWPTPKQSSGGEMFETPSSQKPLRGWDDSPLSASTEKTLPRYFSPYSSQYNSPVSAAEGPSNMQWPEQAWPNSAQEKQAQQAHERGYETPEYEIGLAFGGDDPSIRTKPSNQSIQSHDQPWQVKGKHLDDAYELRPVESSGSLRRALQTETPVLSHPGYGRKHSPPQSRHGGLTEEDAMRGYAV